MSFINSAGRDGEQVSLFEYCRARLNGPREDFENIRDDRPAGNFEQEPISDCVNEFGTKQEHLRDEIIEVNWNSAMIVNNQRWLRLWNIFDTNYLVTWNKRFQFAPISFTNFQLIDPIKLIRSHFLSQIKATFLLCQIQPCASQTAATTFLEAVLQSEP